jgi:adenosylmethionine-8-amino-7-oxononanoate aminotransferase
VHADEAARRCGRAALPLVPIASGKGVWLHDFDGHRYLDGISSWWVNLFGHCQAANQRRAARTAR